MPTGPLPGRRQAEPRRAPHAATLHAAKPAPPASAHVSLTPRFSPTLPATFSPPTTSRRPSAPAWSSDSAQASCISPEVARRPQTTAADTSRNSARPLQSRHRQAITFARSVASVYNTAPLAASIPLEYSPTNECPRPSDASSAPPPVSDTFIFAARSSCDDPRDRTAAARFEHLRRRLVTLYDFPLRPLTRRLLSRVLSALRRP